MRRSGIRLAVAVAAVGALAVGIVAVAVADARDSLRETLTSYQEVPALSTAGEGRFRATIDSDEGEIRYRLSFDDTESAVLQAHIHFENVTNNGPIVVFLCSNLDPKPLGGPGLSGERWDDYRRHHGPPEVSATPASADAIARGIGVGEFDALVAAIRAGATYVNVHTQTRPGGEIRAQLNGAQSRDDD